MIADLKAQALRNGLLTLLDATVHELFDLAAVNTDNMIVMCAVIEFENRHSAFEMMASDQAGRFELR